MHADSIRLNELSVRQHSLPDTYDGAMAGHYGVDLLVEQELLVELKSVRALDKAHRARCVNYLKASGLRVCLLLNFGTARLEIKRVANGL